MSNEFDKNEHGEESAEQRDSQNTQNSSEHPFAALLANIETMREIIASSGMIALTDVAAGVAIPEITPALANVVRFANVIVPSTLPDISALTNAASSNVLSEIDADVFAKILSGLNLPIEELPGIAINPALIDVAYLAGVITPATLPDMTALTDVALGNALSEINADMFTNTSNGLSSSLEELLGITLAPMQAVANGMARTLVTSVSFENIFPNASTIAASSLGESLTVLGAGIFEEISEGVFNNLDRMSTLSGSELQYVIAEPFELADRLETIEQPRRYILLDKDFVDYWGRGFLLMAVYDIGKEVVKIILKHL